MFNQASCCTALGGLSCREAASAQRSPGCYLRARVECKKTGDAVAQGPVRDADSGQFDLCDMAAEPTHGTHWTYALCSTTVRVAHG